MDTKKKKEVLALMKKYGFKEVKEVPQPLTVGLNPFKNIDEGIFMQAVRFDKDWLQDRVIVLLDKAIFSGEGEFNTDYSAFHLIVVDVESDDVGTCIMGGEVLSPKLDKLVKKDFPVVCKFVKKRAWDIRKVTLEK